MAPFVAKAIQTARAMAPDPCRDLPERSRTVRDATQGRELGTCDEAAYASMTPERRIEIALAASIFDRETAGQEPDSERRSRPWLVNGRGPSLLGRDRTSGP